MHPIQFDPISYQINGTPIYLLSGEFHYFRVPKADWHKRMQLFKAAGGNCLATYIPWLIHEPQEGEFRFSGAEWLDVEDFFRAALEEGLYVIARPGPYQYSELIYGGLPAWLCENYPELLAQTYDGRMIKRMSVSYIHPLFLEKVERWFAAVCPIIARHTISQGGAVVFTQLDNELTGIHEWNGSLDYNPVAMGFGQKGGRFPSFLEKRYASIRALNEHYASAYPCFEAVKPPDPAAPVSLHTIRRKKDYFDFYLSTIAEFCQILAGLMRQHGIDTPFIHNSANFESNGYFLETRAALGESFLLGSDHYYNLDQTWGQNNPTPQYAARTFLSLEMLRLMGYPPTVLEMPGGSLSDFPPVTPPDALACYRVNLAYGMKGSNYYVFTGGPNPPGAGETTDLYDYGAGVGPYGEVRPLYQAQVEFGQFIGAHPWLLRAERQVDCRFALDFDYTRSHMFWRERGGFLFSNLEAWNYLRRGPLTAAFCASLSPALVDLGSEDWVGDTGTPLLVTSSSSMAKEKQERLVRFLQGGGKVLITPVLPEMDEALRPCTVLADFLGIPANGIHAGTGSTVRPRVKDTFFYAPEVFYFEHLPAGAEVLGYDELSGKTLAWSLTTPGGGEVIGLGLHWLHQKREHEQVLSALLKDLGLRQKVVCSNPNIWTALWVSGDKAVLFLVNLLTTPMEAEVKIQLQSGGKWIEVGHQAVPPVTVKTIDLPSLVT